MKIAKRLLIISLLATITFSIYCFTPTRLTSKQPLAEDEFSVKIYPGGNTGPLRVLGDKDKLWNNIKDKYPDANPGYIILTGNTPYKFASDPSDLGSFIVYGKVSGTNTDPYDGVIPVFSVVYSDAKLQPISRVDNYLSNFALILFILLPILFLSLLIYLIYVISSEFKSPK